MNESELSQTKEEEEIAQRVLSEYQRMFADRVNWNNHWQEIAERIDPQQFKLFNQKGVLQTQGEKRTEFVYDATGMVALQRFAAIMDSLLTPSDQKWQRLQASNAKVREDRQVKQYFEQVNNVLFRYRYSPHANFASQIHNNYRALGAYGTGTMFTDQLWGKGGGLRYKHCHLNEIFIQENHQGIVDRVLRYFPMTARQMHQKWPDKMPELIKAAMLTAPEKIFFVCHYVCPREDYDPIRLDTKGMPLASYYVSVEGQRTLEMGGYHTFPYGISRYTQMPGEVYGRSPAMDVLPSIKTLNEQKKTMLKQGHRSVDPVLLAHDDGLLDGFDLKPGALNAGGVTADGKVLIHPLPTGNVQAGKEFMDDEKAIINDAFLVSLFQILTDSPTMTATEVLERVKEKGILIAPTVGRQQSELLGPMVERELDVLTRQGLLPPMPGLLREAKGEFTIEYDSPLSRARKAEEASGLMRTLQDVTQVVSVTQDPSPMDHFNWDEIIPAVAWIQAVPTQWLNSQDKIDQMRKQRQQQQQQAQQQQAAPGQAAMLKAAAVAKQSQ